MFPITGEVNCYLFPDDAKQGQADFLGIVKSPGETWIIAYAFTLLPLVDEVIAAQKAGIPMHLYLDHTQSAGVMERGQVARLAAAGCDVTIGTSTTGTRYICHTKGMVVGDTCWEGSVNFSESGWLQVNTAMRFESPEWAGHFVSQFGTLRLYARTYEPQFQVEGT